MHDLRRNKKKVIPFVGEIISCILVFPFAFRYLNRWIVEADAADLVVWFSALYFALGLIHLFRAFRLRDRPRYWFILQQVIAAVLLGCGLMLAFIGYTPSTRLAAMMAYWVCMLAERVLAIIHGRSIWPRLLNGLLCLLIIFAMVIFTADSRMVFLVALFASFASLLSIMGIVFSQIRMDILKEIIRKTYAVEIIFGLLVMMVAFSYVLQFMDDAFPTFWDALWYCFAVVTTIGFGDISATNEIGRVLTVILGVYGIVVVALITSIIVNFYGEMKREPGADNPPARQ